MQTQISITMPSLPQLQLRVLTVFSGAGPDKQFHSEADVLGRCVGSDHSGGSRLISELHPLPELAELDYATGTASTLKHLVMPCHVLPLCINTKVCNFTLPANPRFGGPSKAREITETTPTSGVRCAIRLEACTGPAGVQGHQGNDARRAFLAPTVAAAVDGVTVAGFSCDSKSITAPTTKNTESKH
jgi:hypothetical protein